MIFDLNSCKLNLAILKPSISIYPLNISRTLNKQRVIVDFPAPVLPTTPIFSVGWIINVSPFRTGSKFSLYLT